MGWATSPVQRTQSCVFGFEREWVRVCPQWWCRSGGVVADLQKARADTEQQPHANDAHHGGDAPDKAVHRLIDGGNGLDHILPHPL